MEKFVFTPENLIDNIDKLGPWSAYSLASEALQHYFPEEYADDAWVPVQREVELLRKLGCELWRDAIIKYQKEVGYKELNHDIVNEY